MVDHDPDGVEDERVPDDDVRLLADLADALGGDPLPDGLVERASHLIELQDLGHELAALVEGSEPVGVRAAGPSLAVPGPATPDAVLAFESPEGDVGVDVDPVPGLLRGQVHAGLPVTVDLLRPDGSITPLALDDLGRFALPRPAPGPARIRVARDGAPRVVTDWFVVT